jgi:hypothetical protein
MPLLYPSTSNAACFVSRLFHLIQAGKFSSSFPVFLFCRLTVYRLVPGAASILNQFGIVFSIASFFLNVFFWYLLQAVALTRGFFTICRFTGVQVEYSRRLQNVFHRDKENLRRSIEQLLPTSLLEKIKRQKLVYADVEEQQLSGRVFKNL